MKPDVRFTFEEFLAAAEGESETINLTNTPLGPLFDTEVDLHEYLSEFDNYQSIKQWVAEHLATHPAIEE